MNLAQLRALVAVADQGSFTGAAAALGLTQSAVSHTVASLEKELAVPLVLRRRGGTMLTSHGQQVLRHAREAVHRVDRIAQDCTVVAGRHRGRLRVAAFPSAAQLLPRLIAELARCQPEVTVVLLEGTDAEVQDWLRDRVIDLGVVAELRTGDQPSSPAPGALLAQDQMVAVLDRGHPLAGQPTVALGPGRRRVPAVRRRLRTASAPDAPGGWVAAAAGTAGPGHGHVARARRRAARCHGRARAGPATRAPAGRRPGDPDHPRGPVPRSGRRTGPPGRRARPP